MNSAAEGTTVQDQGQDQTPASYDGVDLSGYNLTDDADTTPDKGEGDAGSAGKDEGPDTTPQGEGEGSEDAGDAGADEGSGGDDAGGGEGGQDDGQSEAETLTIGDKEYSKEELAKAIEESENIAEFRKTTNEKSMEASNLRKAVEPVAELIEALQGDEQLISDLKDSLVEALGEDKRELVENALSFDRKQWQNPFKEDLEAAQAESRQLTDQLEGLKIIAEEKAALRKKYQLSETRLEGVHAFAEKHFEETGKALSLEEAYKLMDYDNQAKRRKATPPDPPNNGGGATDITDNSTAKDYEDIKLTGMFED